MYWKHPHHQIADYTTVIGLINSSYEPPQRNKREESHFENNILANLGFANCCEHLGNDPIEFSHWLHQVSLNLRVGQEEHWGANSLNAALFQLNFHLVRLIIDCAVFKIHCCLVQLTP